MKLKQFYLQLIKPLTILFASALLLMPPVSYGENGWSKATLLKDSSGLTYPAISADGSQIVALDQSKWSYPAGSRELGIKWLEKASGKWKSPVTLATNGIKESFPYLETRPQISADGKAIVYLGNDPADGSVRLYELRREPKGQWSKPAIIEAVPSGWFGMHLSLSASGNRLVYTQGTGGFFGGAQALFVSDKLGGVWQPPVQLPSAYTDGSNFNPLLNPAGDLIAALGSGSSTVPYTIRLAANVWETPTFLAQTSEMEQDLTMSSDGNTLAWYREYVKDGIIHGRDLYWTTYNSQAKTWSKPLKMNSKLLTSSISLDGPPALDQSGKTLIYSMPNQIGDTIATADLWQMTQVSGKWKPAVKITNTTATGGYFLYPKVSKDGKTLISSSGYGLYLQTKTSK